MSEKEISSKMQEIMNRMKTRREELNVSPSYLMGWDEPNEPTTLAAHFDGEEYTVDELNEIRQFAEFVKNKRK